MSVITDFLKKVDAERAAKIGAAVTSAESTLPKASAPTDKADVILQEVSHVGSELSTIAALIPGLQASSLVKLITLAVQLVNVVEEIKQAAQQHDPKLWEEITHSFSSAVDAWEKVPKQ